MIGHFLPLGLFDGSPVESETPRPSLIADGMPDRSVEGAWAPLLLAIAVSGVLDS